MLRPTVLPPASLAPRLAASMMPGPPPVVTTKRRRRAGIWTDHWVSKEASLRASSLARHLEGGLGTGEFGGVGAGGHAEFGETGLGVFAAEEAGRAEKDDGVLDLLAAEASQGLAVFGEDAQDATVGAIEKGFVLVGEGSGFEAIFSHERSRWSFVVGRWQGIRMSPRRRLLGHEFLPGNR